MTPITQIIGTAAQGCFIPHFLDERDYPWVRLLLEEYRRFVGKSKKDLRSRLKEPLPFSAPFSKVLLVTQVLNSLTKGEVQSPLAPRQIRERVFLLATGRNGSDPLPIFNQAAMELGLSSAEIQKYLFADLPDEKIIMDLPADASARELTLKANLAMVQSLLSRSAYVRLRVSGNSRHVVRQAKRQGLLAVVERNREKDSVTLNISGPYSLFRKTTLYGRSLAKLVPVLAWCPSFEMRASCKFKAGFRDLQLKSGDPIFPSDPPALYDSELEQKFARGFRKITDNWDLIREPEPIEASGTLLFPDFSIEHRTDKSRKWILEIMGYWTQEYLTSKLERLRDAKINNFILCLREDYNCSEKDLPASAKIVKFKRFIDPKDVLKVLEN